MSAEDELIPQVDLPLVAADAAAFAEYWDDTEPDQRNIQVIGWWLRRRPGAEPVRPDL